MIMYSFLLGSHWILERVTGSRRESLDPRTEPITTTPVLAWPLIHRELKIVATSRKSCPRHEKRILWLAT